MSRFRKDEKTYGSDKSTRILTSLLARSVLVPFRFYVLIGLRNGVKLEKFPTALVSAE